MQLDRIIETIRLLASREVISASELAEYFNVTIRTIQRDIDTISLAGLPVYAQRGAKGVYKLLDTFEWSKSYFNADEYTLLMSIADGLEDILPTSKHSLLRQRLSKLKSQQSFENGLKQSIRFDFKPWINQSNVENYFNVILEAIQGNNILKIVYANQREGVLERRIEPYFIQMKESGWYLYGYCLEKKGFRFFKITRIKDLKTTQDYFIRRSLAKPEIFSDIESKLELIKLQFEPSCEGRVLDLFGWNGIRYLDNKIELTFNYPIDEWLIEQLLSFGSKLTVVEPEKLKNMIEKEIRSLCEKYKVYG